MIELYITYKGYKIATPISSARNDAVGGVR